MANTNDLIYSKLKARFPTEGATIGDLLYRYRNGETYLDLPQFSTGDWVGANPSSDPPATSGRIFVAVDVEMPDWTPSAIKTLISRWEPLFNFKSWLLQINTTGNVVATYSPDGSTDRAFSSSVATGFADGTRHAIGADIEPNDGAGNRQVTFYTATSIDAADWVQLGTVQEVAGAESIQTTQVGQVSLAAHGFLGTTAQFAGKMYAAQVRNGGIAGTIVAWPRFMAASEAGNPRIEEGSRLWIPPAFNGKLATGVAYVLDDPDFAITDLDVRAKVTLADWTPSSTHWIINQGSHTNPTPDLQWTFSLHPNGALRTFVSTDGTLTGAGPESIPQTFVNGSTHYLRCTVDTNNGANSVFTYYESFDEGQTWQALGPPILDVIVNPVFQTTRPIQTATLNPGTQTLHKAQLRSSIDGPIVLDAEIPLSPTYVDKAGKTWNVTGAITAQLKQQAIASTPLLPKHEDYVAHVAGASASLNLGDDANAFWDAFTP